MTDGVVLDNTVEWFSSQMLTKLQKPKNTGKKHWTEVKNHALLICLKREVSELQNAMMFDEGSKSVISECADVANFAMMIADKYKLEAQDD